jgi:hypothetical protein
VLHIFLGGSAIELSTFVHAATLPSLKNNLLYFFALLPLEPTHPSPSALPTPHTAVCFEPQNQARP